MFVTFEVSNFARFASLKFVKLLKEDEASSTQATPPFPAIMRS